MECLKDKKQLDLSNLYFICREKGEEKCVFYSLGQEQSCFFLALRERYNLDLNYFACLVDSNITIDAIINRLNKEPSWIDSNFFVPIALLH